MKPTSTTIRKLQLRPVPIALGIFLTAVTARVMFDDILHGAEVTTSHFLSVAAIVVALASGHMAWPQIKARGIVSGVMLGVLFLASTSYVVVSSGARNAEQASAKAAKAEENARQRGEVSQMKHEAEIILNSCSAETPKRYWGVRCGLRDAMTAECQSGKGSKCDGKAYSVTTYEAAIAGYDTKLAELGPEHRNDGYAHTAKVLAALPWVTTPASDIEARLALLLPFIVVLIAELGTITFLHIGIGHTETHSTAPAPTRTHSSEETAQTSFPDLTEVDPRWFKPDPTPPRGPRKSPPKLPENVVALRAHPVIRALEATGGSVSSNKELAELLGVSTGEASKMHQEVADQIHTERVGKELRISLRRRVSVA